MEMTFKRYVAISERTLTDIAISIGESRQNCDHWVRRESPVFVDIDPDKFESIKRVYRVKEIYSRPQMHSVRKTKRQVKS